MAATCLPICTMRKGMLDKFNWPLDRKKQEDFRNKVKGQGENKILTSGTVSEMAA